MLRLASPWHHIGCTALATSLCLSSCSTTSTISPRETTNKEHFEAAPSSIDKQRNKASLEEFILALPPYSLHEETVEGFRERVYREHKEQQAKHDEMHLSGDGCWPSKDIKLDRTTSTLYILSYPGPEPDSEYTLHLWRRVRGGWEYGNHIYGQAALDTYRSKGGTVTDPNATP